MRRNHGKLVTGRDVSFWAITTGIKGICSKPTSGGIENSSRIVGGTEWIPREPTKIANELKQNITPLNEKGLQHPKEDAPSSN